jgi:hypothetical protein
MHQLRNARPGHVQHFGNLLARDEGQVLPELFEFGHVCSMSRRHSALLASNASRFESVAIAPQPLRRGTAIL